MSVITLNKVRMIYPTLTAAAAVDQAERSQYDSKPQISCTFLLDPTTHAAGIKKIGSDAEQLFKEEKFSAGMKGIKHCCLVEGDTLTDKNGDVPDHYNGVYVLKTKAYLDNPPAFVDASVNPSTYDALQDHFYNGAFCNVQVELKLNKQNKILRANLIGIQPRAGGERLSLGGYSPQVVAAGFDDYGDEFDMAESESE